MIEDTEIASHCITDFHFHSREHSTLLNSISVVSPTGVREDMKNIPILRRLDRSRVVSSTKILPAGKFAHMMIDLGYRAVYTGKFSPYAVRRGHGNTIDRK